MYELTWKEELILLSRQKGRLKILCSLTTQGEKALAEAQKIQRQVWGEISDLPG